MYPLPQASKVRDPPAAPCCGAQPMIVMHAAFEYTSALVCSIPRSFNYAQIYCQAMSH